MKKTIFFIFILSVTFVNLFSQEYYRRDNNYLDTATFMIWASPNFSVQFPFGKGYLASTFNYNYNIGIDFSIKTKSNWTLDAVFNYMFGSKVIKSPEDILGDIVIKTDNGSYVIFNGAGNNAVVLTYEGRYWYFGCSAGKILPFNRWKNSGFWLKCGVGYFGHKIHFTDPNNFFPQIDQKKYRLGYDQRSQGIALNQFFGYLFMQKRRVLSFYAGIEVWEIFSKPDRGYIFVGDLAGSTNNLKTKFSGLVAIKVGWVLPFYEKKRVTTFYYY
ncbi:MAG: hypothetical protein LBU83_10250 [Bacteroidales bacterium]|jgi:hypothetical protein|nr:hypothetical protein [Bacteroidales bacterium]